MCPMAVLDSLDFSLLDADFAEMLYNNLPGIDFEEIAKEAAADMQCVMQDGNLGLHFDNTKITQDGNIGLHFDNTKITQDNWVDLPFDSTELTQDMSWETMGLPLPPSAVVVQAPSPFPGLSPEMVLLQPVSPGALEEPDMSMDLHTAVSLCSVQSISPDPGYVQVASPEPCPVQPAGPVHQYTVVALPSQLPVDSALSPFPVPMEEETKVLPARPLVNEAAASKKRGRRNKPEGSTSRRRREKKIKVYEMGPKVDIKEERKRVNAVNAKLHRDKQKNERESLATQLQQARADRDRLIGLVEELQNSEALLFVQLANKQRGAAWCCTEHPDAAIALQATDTTQGALASTGDVARRPAPRPAHPG